MSVILEKDPVAAPPGRGAEPFAPPRPTPRPSEAAVVALVIAAGLLLFGLNVDFLLAGDAAMYGDYVLRRQFDELTLHIGYYAVLYLADLTVGRLGVPMHELMAWVNVACGALTLGVAYLLARDLLGTRRDALLCVLLLAVCARVISNATTSEIYMLQTGLSLAAFLLFGRGRVVTAGMLAGAAMLVSPLSAFAFLYFPALDVARARRLRWGVLLRLAAGAAAVYLPYLAVSWRELLWGHRGLLDVNGGVRLDVPGMLRQFPRFQLKAYTVLLLLALPALRVARAHGRLLAVSLAVALPHLYVISKLTLEDNVFILTTDFFFACWLVPGWRELERRRTTRWLPPALLAAHLALLVAAGVLFRFEPHRAFATELREVARTRLLRRDATLISDWSGVMAATYFGRPAATTAIEREPLFRQMYDITAIHRMDPRLLDARELYLLEAWHPGGLYRLLAPRGARAAQWRDNAIVALADRDLGLACSPVQRGIYPLYRCARKAPAAEGGP